jgi:hypothetical protein
MVAVGFTIAAGLYLAGSRMKRDWNRAWEFAAVLAFLGFAASMLSDSGETLAVLDQMQTGGGNRSFQVSLDDTRRAGHCPGRP